MEQVFASVTTDSKLRLCYYLVNLIKNIDEAIPQNFSAGLISKLLIACEAVQYPITADARLLQLNNDFRLAKLMADYNNNSGKESSALFNSLLLQRGQENLPELIALLEVDNLNKRRLAV